jgi:hypothetical protein
MGGGGECEIAGRIVLRYKSWGWQMYWKLGEVEEERNTNEN